jgi:hypothetical protein
MQNFQLAQEHIPLSPPYDVLWYNITQAATQEDLTVLAMQIHLVCPRDSEQERKIIELVASRGIELEMNERNRAAIFQARRDALLKQWRNN